MIFHRVQRPPFLLTCPTAYRFVTARRMMLVAPSLPLSLACLFPYSIPLSGESIRQAWVELHETHMVITDTVQNPFAAGRPSGADGDGQTHPRPDWPCPVCML